MTGGPRPPGPRNAQVGANVKAAREEAGLSQTALAEAIGDGWTQGIVAKLEVGRTAMRIEQLLDLVGALRVNPDELLAGTFTPAPKRKRRRQ